MDARDPQWYRDERSASARGASYIDLANVRIEQHMRVRQELKFLRDRAQRLREMAQHQTPLSDQLKVMAAELEAVADELERKQGRAAD